jgi:hypothetical protein
LKNHLIFARRKSIICQLQTVKKTKRHNSLEFKLHSQYLKKDKSLNLTSLKICNLHVEIILIQYSFPSIDCMDSDILVQHETILNRWTNNVTMFVSTRASEYVFKCISMQPSVTVTGNPGVGKTATMRSSH